MNRWIIPVIVILLIAPFLSTAQEDETAELLLSVSGESCALQIDPESVGGQVGAHSVRPGETTPEATEEPEATPEATVEPDAETPDWLPDLPTYTLGEDCADLESLLTVAANGRLWLALLTENDDEWLPLDTLEDDPYPPQLDGRGRYFGCAIPDEGEQACYVRVTLDEAEYLVAVPLWVGDAYYAPAPTATDAPVAQETPMADNPPQQDTGGNPPPPTQVPDSDGDGVPDDQDDCPNEGASEFGLGDNGCPEGPPGGNDG
jgi:hypothetical protein